MGIFFILCYVLSLASIRLVAAAPVDPHYVSNIETNFASPNPYPIHNFNNRPFPQPGGHVGPNYRHNVDPAIRAPQPNLRSNAPTIDPNFQLPDEVDVLGVERALKHAWIPDSMNPDLMFRKTSKAFLEQGNIWNIAGSLSEKHALSPPLPKMLQILRDIRRVNMVRLPQASTLPTQYYRGIWAVQYAESQAFKELQHEMERRLKKKDEATSPIRSENKIPRAIIEELKKINRYYTISAERSRDRKGASGSEDEIYTRRGWKSLEKFGNFAWGTSSKKIDEMIFDIHMATAFVVKHTTGEKKMMEQEQRYLEDRLGQAWFGFFLHPDLVPGDALGDRACRALARNAKAQIEAMKYHLRLKHDAQLDSMTTSLPPWLVMIDRAASLYKASLPAEVESPVHHLERLTQNTKGLFMALELSGTISRHVSHTEAIRVSSSMTLSVEHMMERFPDLKMLREINGEEINRILKGLDLLQNEFESTFKPLWLSATLWKGNSRKRIVSQMRDQMRSMQAHRPQPSMKNKRNEEIEDQQYDDIVAKFETLIFFYEITIAKFEGRVSDTATPGMTRSKSQAGDKVLDSISLVTHSVGQGYSQDKLRSNPQRYLDVLGTRLFHLITRNGEVEINTHKNDRQWSSDWTTKWRELNQALLVVIKSMVETTLRPEYRNLATQLQKVQKRIVEARRTIYIDSNNWDAQDYMLFASLKELERCFEESAEELHAKYDDETPMLNLKTKFEQMQDQTDKLAKKLDTVAKTSGSPSLHESHVRDRIMEYIDGIATLIEQAQSIKADWHSIKLVNPLQATSLYYVLDDLHQSTIQLFRSIDTAREYIDVWDSDRNSDKKLPPLIEKLEGEMRELGETMVQNPRKFVERAKLYNYPSEIDVPARLRRQFLNIAGVFHSIHVKIWEDLRLVINGHMISSSAHYQSQPISNAKDINDVLVDVTKLMNAYVEKVLNDEASPPSAPAKELPNKLGKSIKSVLEWSLAELQPMMFQLVKKMTTGADIERYISTIEALSKAYDTYSHTALRNFVELAGQTINGLGELDVGIRKQLDSVNKAARDKSIELLKQLQLNNEPFNWQGRRV